MDIEDFVPDEQLDDDGVWLDLDDETQVKVRYLPPDAIQREIFRRQKRRGFRMQTFDDFDSIQKVTNEVLEGCIIDWRGLKRNGKEFLFSKENLRFLLASRPEFRQAFETMVRNVENFRRTSEEKNRKNLQTVSSGSLTTDEIATSS